MHFTANFFFFLYFFGHRDVRWAILILKLVTIPKFNNSDCSPEFPGQCIFQL